MESLKLNYCLLLKRYIYLVYIGLFIHIVILQCVAIHKNKLGPVNQVVRIFFCTK